MVHSNGPQPKRTKLDDAEFVCEAHDVINFHLLHATSEEELRKEIETGGETFKGEFFHQHFGEDEVIKGFLELQIDVWFSGHTYHTWIDVKWQKRKAGADKVVQILQGQFPHALSSKDAMVTAVVRCLDSSPDMRTHGRKLTEVCTPLGQVSFVKYNFADEDPCTTYVKEIHERLEPLLLFFIDGVSTIDNKDPKWELLLAVLLPKAPGRGHLVMGMQTMYNFWALPEGKGLHRRINRPPAKPQRGWHEQGMMKLEREVQVQESREEEREEKKERDVQESRRLRLSQVLLLPPYQGLGLGKRMLQLAYTLAVEKKCIDLTLEDPSPQLCRVREKLEVEMLTAQAWVAAQVQECVNAADSAMLAADAVRALVPPSKLMTRIGDEMMMHKRQARVVWEALLYLSCESIPSVLGHLQSMIRKRLDADIFGPCTFGADMKKVHDVALIETKKEKAKLDKEDKLLRSFIMMRTAGTAVGPTADGDGAAGSEGMATSGRHSLVLVPAKEKADRLDELLDERMGELETLARLVRRPGAAGLAQGASVVPSKALASKKLVVDAQAE